MAKVAQLEVIGALIDFASLSEKQLERAIRELHFQHAMAKGGVASVRGAKKQHLQEIMRKYKAMHAWMAREMLRDEVEAQALKRQDEVVIGLLEEGYEHNHVRATEWA